jgi:hypothetical protein
MMRRELVEEWRRLYEELCGDELVFDARATWRQLEEQIVAWMYSLISSAKRQAFRGLNLLLNSNPMLLRMRGPLTPKLALL